MTENQEDQSIYANYIPKWQRLTWIQEKQLPTFFCEVHISLIILYLLISKLFQLKLQSFLKNHPNDNLFTTSYLNRHGLSNALLQKEKKKQTISPFGRGAWYVGRQKPGLFSAIAVIQQQENKPVHVGGLTALILHQRTHYIYSHLSEVWLFSRLDTTIPSWFQHMDWPCDKAYHRTHFLPPDLGLVSHENQSNGMWFSSVERATLECLHQAPQKISLAECYQNIECLVFPDDIDTDLMQVLLEQCQSYKVKRLFLSFAEQNEVAWFDDLDVSRIPLGKGMLSPSPYEGGVYDPKYRLLIPHSVKEVDFPQERFDY